MFLQCISDVADSLSGPNMRVARRTKPRILKHEWLYDEMLVKQGSNCQLVYA